MPCNSPLNGYRSAELTPNGKRKIVFSVDKGFIDLPVQVPCGRCMGCRLEYARQWAMRCVHEASLHDENCFITLTYDRDHVPVDGSLKVRDFQLFMKRLRKAFPDKRIRFFHCGEYGELNGRPHYHAILFGFNFDDWVFVKKSYGVDIYTSPTLEKIWQKGFVTVGTVTFESASYVARYITKKVKGEDAEEHYRRLDSTTGESWSIHPEYTTMSRRPGIASDWFSLYGSDVYPKDFTSIRGKLLKPPKFYDRLLEKTHLEMYEEVKEKRVREAVKRKSDNTTARLSVKEICKKSMFNKFKRNPEK